MEKIIFENENEKHIQLPDGKVRILTKKGIKDARERDFRLWVSQRWWRRDLKGLKPIERCILISYQMVGLKYPRPSERFIARELGISRNSVSKYVKKFHKKGWL